MSTLESRKNCVGNVLKLFEFKYGGETQVRVDDGSGSGDTIVSHYEPFHGRLWHVIAPTEDHAMAAWKASTDGAIYQYEGHAPVCTIDQIITPMRL